MLILFDIDGTLIDSGEAGTRSLDLTFRALFSIENAFRDISMAGKTDIQIMKEGLLKHGISFDGNLPVIIETYLKNLRREINNPWKHLKPGIKELLERLSEIEGIHLGLLTGNLEQGARIKLEPFGLNRYFPSGAFGSDDEDRNRLLPIAIQRFRLLTGRTFSPEDCIVIGDTPRDVYCSKPYGARCIAVATGPYKPESLKKAGADVVFEDMSNVDEVLKFLRSKNPF
ncbi:MAG: HAD hydrolase-like protein [Thermodesulfovibrionales bacterium]|nr:HAD hydrolase-like protein [Thermodesulfovibrionales bacterium]